MRSSPPSTLFRGWQRRVRSPLVWAGEYSYERDILRNIHQKNKAVVYGYVWLDVHSVLARTLCRRLIIHGGLFYPPTST